MATATAFTTAGRHMMANVITGRILALTPRPKPNASAGCASRAPWRSARGRAAGRHTGGSRCRWMTPEVTAGRPAPCWLCQRASAAPVMSSGLRLLVTEQFLDPVPPHAPSGFSGRPRPADGVSDLVVGCPRRQRGPALPSPAVLGPRPRLVSSSTNWPVPSSTSMISTWLAG